jgi:hypothetical protein
VRHHRPEPAQGLSGDADAELRDVTLENGADVVLTPQHAGGVAGGEERPEQFEQVGPPLNLVDDDEPREAFQRLERGRETPEIERVLEVERLCTSAGGEGPGQRRLARLTRTDERHGRVDAKRLRQSGTGADAWKHIGKYT